jgi:predicted amidophosphoribosyltransferase
VEVHGFLAGDLQRVVNTQAGRFRRIDPPGESRKPLRNRQRIIVDDIVDTGSAVSAATVAATASSM